MIAHAPRSLCVSALLHGVVFALVLFWMMPARQKPEPLMSPSVFMLMPGSAAIQAKDSGATGWVRPVLFTPPSVPVHVPSSVLQETEPVSEEVTPAPIQMPLTVRSQVSTPESSVHTPARTTIDEFRKQHSAMQTSSVAKRSAPARPMHIDLDTVLTSAPSSSSRVSPSTVSDAREAEAYLSRLFAKLRAAHRKPPGLDAGLRVRVEFFLSVDGSLSGVHLLDSSGDSSFDESVLEAFRRVTGLGAPPKGLEQTNQVTFRTDADE